MTFDRQFELFIMKYNALESTKTEIRHVYEFMIETYQGGGKLLACGNGGSAADSEHIVGELMKGFQKPRALTQGDKARFLAVPHGARLAQCLQTPLPAISLVSQTGLITAVANDTDPALVFAQQVFGYGRAGDLLLALSTSGNSENVVCAAAAAKALGLRAAAITGRQDSQLSALCDHTIRLPADTPADVQELTLPVYHFLCAATEEYFFG
ncbi:MAG: SIS domain-containing protein [Clostridia bacterium]|nr:SIS domain-containing protein [Clostridia bacterium]